MLTLLLWLAVLLLVVWLCLYIIRTMPVDPPIRAILSVIVLLAAILYLLRYAGVL